MTGERLVRVERFEELKAGMLVVVKPCSWCGSSHRGMLTCTGRAEGFIRPNGGSRLAGGAYWIYHPQPARCPGRLVGTGEFGINEHVIADGRVYRVETGLEAPSHQEPAKLPEPVR